MQAVRIIIPVYSGLEQTQQCIESVAKSCAGQDEISIEVTNDASPDAELASWLDHRIFQLGGQWSLRKQHQNMGFTATCNAAMQRAVGIDLVLLNADTIVAGNWLQRMQRQAYADQATCTVTPFSNNASICSFPEFATDNPLPEGVSVDVLDQLFATTNRGESLDLPTAVGFCMYIKASCRDDVGLFDAQKYPRGYGEENDFSLRASAQGWRHKLAADVFVFHHGSASFGDERFDLMAAARAQLREDFPEYFLSVQRFVKSDPPRPFREKVMAKLAQSLELKQ